MRLNCQNIVLGLFAIFAAAKGECPMTNEYPVMLSNETFLCARLYTGVGTDNMLRSCNQCDGEPHFYDVGSKEDYVSESGMRLAGSIFIMPGCTFYGYNETYSTFYDEHVGPKLIANNVGGVGYTPGGSCSGLRVPGYKSYQCRCGQKPISCTPEDDYQTIAVLDNLEANFPVTLTYERTVGTAFSEEMEESFGISAEIKAELTAGFLETFSATLGLSVGTNYDWRTLSASERNSETSMTVQLAIPARTYATVSQAVGTCGGSTIKTVMYKVQEFDYGGNVTREYLH